MYRDYFWVKVTAIVVGIMLVIATPIVWINYAWFHTTNSATCQVVSKDRTSTSSGGSDIRIYTKQCGVLAISDSIVMKQYRTADVYAMLKPGKTYSFYTVGWRSGFWSTFPTISSVDGKYPR